MISLNFINEYQPEYSAYQVKYTSLVMTCLKVLKLDADYEISVTLIDNETIHQMNKNYRFKDYPTDVLSFENEIDVCYDDSIDLGDIFISVDKAIEQAQEYQHSLERELSFLFVHGLLHCLGYNHLNNDDETEMMKLQEVILDADKNKESNEK